MSDVLEALLQSVLNIQGAGDFQACGSRRSSHPGIIFPDGDELALPLSRAQAREISSMAEVAPYGKGEETIRDDSVRKCWQMDASELRWIEPKWSKTTKRIVQDVSKDLGVEGQVKAEPYKLLLHGEGGFFLPHRDTEKLGEMFGTLIIALPSRHEGGELLIRHGGEEVPIDFSQSDPRGSSENSRSKISS